MYKITVNLGTHKEYVVFYSMWGALNMAHKYGKCADVVSVALTSEETGELGLYIENGKIDYIADHEF